MIVRLARFAVVGASGAGINLSLFWFLSARLGWLDLVASAAAFELALLSNYVLNHHWTFADRTPASASLLRYQVAGLGGLCIALGVVSVATTGLGIQPLVANALGIAAAMAWNFTTSLSWTWRTPALAHQPA